MRTPVCTRSMVSRSVSGNMVPAYPRYQTEARAVLVILREAKGTFMHFGMDAD